MSYKTILLHADAARSAPLRVQLAAMLAAQQQAHLVCAAMTGISRYVYRQAGADSALNVEQVQQATERARQALQQCAQLANQASLASCEQRLVADDAYGGLVLQARYADLIVVSQADRDDPATGALLQDLPEFVALNCPRPVLVVPFAGSFPTLGEQVVIGWDGSLQAARAVAHALPILRRARRVTLALFDAVIGDDEHGEEPGADIALYLARHGVQVEVLRQPSGGDVGEALLAAADSLQADLVVMGAYGHTRFREILLGGATRTVLETMTVPVLLAH